MSDLTHFVEFRDRAYRTLCGVHRKTMRDWTGTMDEKQVDCGNCHRILEARKRPAQGDSK